jgi:hypothetical protein
MFFRNGPTLCLTASLTPDVVTGTSECQLGHVAILGSEQAAVGCVAVRTPLDEPAFDE